MANQHSFRGLLHRATHRIPGVPTHGEQSAGHHGTGAAHSHAQRRGVTPRLSLNRRRNHSTARPPWFMPAWQRRIAAFFGREV